MRFRTLLLAAIAVLLCSSLFAQQTGSITGKVTSEGQPLPGVTVEARSNVLPTPRTTTTDANGSYSLPALPPGTYTVSFSLAGMQTVTRQANVTLAQVTAADVKMGVQGVAESITVTAEATLVNKASTAIESGITQQQIQTLPVGQQYRDLLKLVPGIEQTPNSVRGPSAGGSGQDNVYQFDGVNVTMPLYGTLSSEPASYDIAQVTTIKGGAKAVDFDRAGGFWVDSVSRSGTNRIAGQAEFQLQSASMTAKQNVANTQTFNRDQNWTSIGIGGPIVRDMLFFYGSYYRPQTKQNSQANNYGALPNYDLTRNEGFGKLTFTPTQSFLINGSYRGSTENERNVGFGSFTAVSAGQANRAQQRIGTGDVSWIISPNQFATLKFTDFGLKTSGLPLTALSGVTPSTALGTQLDIHNLPAFGMLFVPCFTGTGSANACDPANVGTSASNLFRAQYMQQYGYVGANGARFGGGAVGAYDTLVNADNFFRKSGQIGYNLTLGSNITHDLHVAYQRYQDVEDLQRLSNGWGDISVIGGSSTCPSNTQCKGQPYYFVASFYQATLGSTPVRKIHAPFDSQSLELNDTIRWNRWSFNVGVIGSQDTLKGQGLADDPSTLSGYVLAPGHQYTMYKIPWSKEIQPRLGATWAYNGEDTVYASFATYNPAATSLPRAASWDRNYTIRTINAYFDQNGVLIGTGPLRSSSGKLFVPNMKPRTTNEYLLGTSQQINNQWSARVYTRYRKTTHFWEDTNNTARSDYGCPGGDPYCNKNIPTQDYIPDLNAKIGQIGSGSSYVIAELDGAFTKYYEATAESDWRSADNKFFVRGSYTWSHYYGNFDQDNTAGAGNNDSNIYIGSSNIADGPGHQLWDLKYGNLTGDRRHLLKAYGSYMLPWHASAGAYALYQSGSPWTPWNYELYNFSTDNGTSDTIKFAAPAGSRRSPAHYQLDLNYTQNFGLTHGLNLQLIGQVFNLFNKQTGYDYQPSVHSANFGNPQYYWAPRRFQIAAAVQF